MSKRRDGQRIETPDAKLRRLRSTLLGFYRADPRYRLIADQDLHRLWVPAAVLHSGSGVGNQNAAASYRTYWDQLDQVVAERLRLCDAAGRPAVWAVDGVHEDVVSGAARARGGWNIPGPGVATVAYPEAPRFTLAVSPAWLSLDVSWEDARQTPAETDVGVGDEGFGGEAWSRLRAEAHRLVDAAVDGMQEEFAKTYGTGAPTRGTTVRNQRQTLEALYRFLFRNERPEHENGPTGRRALRAMAKTLGLALPRG